jgi:hypothetical protein
MEQLIHSAALYCEPNHEGHVSIAWVEGAVHLLRSHGLQVREYGVGETPVCSLGAYAFRDNDPQLLAAVRSGVLRDLELYCHPRNRRDLLADWDGTASVSFSRGYVHVGLPASSGVSLASLLRQTYALARPLAPWPYGIAYPRFSSKAPDMYALGIIGGDFPYPDVSREDLDRIGCWYHERMGRRRYLKGRLRDVYSANLLSAKHVRARVGKDKTLLTAGWGEFTQLDDAMWLWTVAEDDIPEVRAALRGTKLLLCA